MSFSVHYDPEYLTSSVLTVPHCFTTRHGGVSIGYLSSLNLGIHRGDVRANVEKNYEILGNAVGFDPDTLVFTHQTHTAIVAKVGKADCGDGLKREVTVERDGLVTNETGVTLIVFSADCTPILLHDPVHHAIAAVHSGWRGTASGIVRNAVLRMNAEYGSEPRDIEAAIGPCIGRCCFETHSDVPDAMLDALGDAAMCGITEDGNGKFHVDLKAINRLWLELAGVEKIDVSEDCTACQPDRFWSHRKVGNERGSLAAIIRL